MRAIFARRSRVSAGYRNHFSRRLSQVIAIFVGIAVASLSPAIASETITYTYDALGRLVKVDHGTTGPNAGASSTYTFDKASNRTQVVVTGGSGVVTLTISPTSLPGGTVGTAYSQTITASGGSGGYSYTISSGALPAGLTLNSSTGVLSGTPTTATTYSFTVTATDSSAHTGSQSYSVAINSGATLTLSPTSLPAGTLGTPYSQTITASGGSGGYTYAVSSGTLPAGLSLNGSTGVLSGTPTSAATYSFSVKATDSSSKTGSQPYSITISSGTGGTCTGVSFKVADNSTNEGTNIIFQITKVGSTSDTCTVSYSTADGTAKAGTDYAAQSGSMTFLPSDVIKSPSVTTIDNGAVTPALTMYLNLSNPSGVATISDAQAIGTINDVDAGGSTACSNVSFSIADATPVNEGGNLSFRISKNGKTTADCSISYASQDGTAHAGTDYTARSGSFTFTPDVGAIIPAVITLDNGVVTGPLTMYMNLSSLFGGATITRGQAVGTINNVDTGGAPAMALSPRAGPSTSNASMADQPPVCSDVTIELVHAAASFQVTNLMVLGQCSDPDGDTLTVTSPALPYTIDLQSGGPTSVVSTVSDGRGGTATQTINIVRD